MLELVCVPVEEARDRLTKAFCTLTAEIAVNRPEDHWQFLGFVGLEYRNGHYYEMGNT